MLELVQFPEQGHQVPGQQDHQAKVDPVINLDKYRITSMDDIPANVYVGRIGGTSKFSKGNISAWTGAAKSKKTFALTMCISSMLMGATYGNFQGVNKNRVIWIDTEQSPNDVQKVTKRIQHITGLEKNLRMYALRPLSPKERVKQIEVAIASYDCDVLVIDGVRDLVTNFNDPVESTEMITRLMKWSYDKDIHVTTVLHQSNGGAKVRGHLGTEVENKAETVIKVYKDEHIKEMSHVEEMYGRGRGFDEFVFTVDNNGIPVCGDQIQEMPVVGAQLVDPDDVPF